ncbi:hypothetical protein DFS33DRAFT_1436723 [Desarmillaria ectypa]|nr:hypothetical protein DFS33DRAFT_1436723 [Desarmillaria ectypa]
MLASTPIKDYTSHRKTRDGSMSPLRSQSATMKQPTLFDKPLLTPSPHRSTGKPLFLPHAELGGQNSTDVIFLHSPFQTPAKMRKPRQQWNEDETLVVKTVRPLLTPARQPPALAAKQLNATIAHPPSRVGTGTKRKTTPNATPLRPNTLTPLVVTSSKPFGPSGMSFDRLGPLPPPKFGPRTPRTGTEADASLRNQTTTFTRLKISDLNQSDDDDDSGCDISEPPTGPLFGGDYPPKQTGGDDRRLMNAKQEEVVEAVSPGGHITKRRARSRPVSDELLESVFNSPSPGERPSSGGRNFVAFPPATHHARKSPNSSASNVLSPLPRCRIPTNAPKTPQPFHARGPLARVDSATLFFGPSVPHSRPRTTTLSTASSSGRFIAPRPPTSNRHSYAGSDGEKWNFLQTRPILPSPQSFPTSHNIRETHYDSTDDDDDMLCEGPRDSSFLLSIDTPSPRHTDTVIPSKFKPNRDSGVVVSDDEVSMNSSASGDHVPQASTSVSSIFSDDEHGLLTPGLCPPALDGWPGVYEADDNQQGSDVDAFIKRTLAAPSKTPYEVKKVPNTPVKKVKTSYLSGDRPWQSAVAHRVGLGIDWEIKQAKVPRKSLPLGFPPAGRKHRKSFLDPSTDSEDDPEDSPSTRKEKERYDSLGIGRPSLPTPKEDFPAVPKSRWLSRRTSSGTFSSGSDSMSMIGTPTRNQTQEPPRRKAVGHTPRSASSSSLNSVLSSPTTARVQPSPGHQRPPVPRKSYPTRPSLTSSQDSGRFDRDFVELEEIGSGEFGRVIKVHSKADDDCETYAIKKSKTFEGIKHRHRLREEVDILRHLRLTNDGQRHPNVLAFVDSWEEDEALFIQTELCDLGNLAHFLWEYGRQYPRLEEARVWKIIADLSNGLTFIHTAGVIHLDLKPANIFVTSDGRFKIGDFGMASLWPRPPQETYLGPTAFEREGDKLYLAPEVLQGRYGKAADIFSFGMMMLETAANIVVPDQGEPWHRLRREDFSQVDLDDSPELLELIQQMMRTDPALRIGIQAIYSHPVVSRARMNMEMLYNVAVRDGTSLFAASPLASVSSDFLEEILGHAVGSGAMDLSP